MTRNTLPLSKGLPNPSRISKIILYLLFIYLGTFLHPKNIAKLARALYPNSNKYSKVMGNLYMDKAALDTKIGNFSGAINIYEEAQNQYPELGFRIKVKLYSIADSLMKYAYFSYKENKNCFKKTKYPGLLQTNG